MDFINENLLDSHIQEVVEKKVHRMLIQGKARADQEMFTPIDAAKYLGVSKSTFNRAVSRGLIKPTYPFGNDNRYYL